MANCQRTQWRLLVTVLAICIIKSQGEWAETAKNGPVRVKHGVNSAYKTFAITLSIKCK